MSARHYELMVILDAELEERTGFGLDPDARVGALRTADQQKAEILRAIAREAQVILMDEPTAALTTSEVERLFRIVETLRDRGVAVLFISQEAHFLAVVQVVVYAGAIVVLFLFGVMLTRAQHGHENELDNDQRGVAVVTALFLLGIVGYVLVDFFEDDKLPKLEGATKEAITASRGTGAVGNAIFSTYLVPFEVVSVLLLAALVGAILVSRKAKADAATAAGTPRTGRGTGPADLRRDTEGDR